MRKTKMSIVRDTTLADDLLRGIPAIAEFIGQPERIAYYQAEKGIIPCGKSGGNWIASKRRLRAFYDALTAGPVPRDG
jgi:hypothetical protein